MIYEETTLNLHQSSFLVWLQNRPDALKENV